MPLRDILVHVDGTPESERRLRAGFALARRHDAHLTALFVIDSIFPYYPIDASFGYLSWDGAQPFLDDLLNRAKVAAQKAQAMFERLLVSEDVRGVWHCVEGSTAETIQQHALFTDLCILGQEDPASQTRPPDGLPLERVLFGAGRPVLVIPFHGEYEQIGTEILVGWKASRESVRAVNDALPLLQSARHVTVLTANEDHHAAGGQVGQAAIARHLALHDVEVVRKSSQGEIGAEGNMLLDCASDLGANLLVIGAYGHSRLREVMLGGVTRTILRHMTLPVLLSH